MLNKVFLAASLLACLAMTGCEFFNPIGPIIQIGVMWIEGEAHKYYNTDDDTILVATKTVLRDLKFSIVEENQQDGYYWIKAVDNSRTVTLSNGETAASTFKIKVREVKERITKLSIRVNTFGDHPYVEMIYRHVDKQPGVIQFTTTKELNAAYHKRGRP
tara:strand:- start:906 stop:1385 length:480 start_codon:yes stop_codon:yes gene_type:complete